MNGVDTVYQIIDNRKNGNGRPDLRSVLAEVVKYLPSDLLPKVTILLQGSGYVTIKPTWLDRTDWGRFNDRIKRLGGLWISNYRYSHWSIPLSQAN